MNKRFNILIGISILIGLPTAHFNLWDWIEPVMGWGSLLFAGLAFMEAQAANRAIQNVGSSMPLKSFSVTIGLREGYEQDAHIRELSSIQEHIAQWMEERKNAGLQVVTGMLQEATLLYPVRNNNESGNRVVSEPTARYFGELSAKYDKDHSDADTIATISDLARWVGEATSQKRVYCTYCDQQWVLDI